jgi:undecaprenyl pyrophosphate synthase
LTANLPKDIANKTVKNPQTGKDIKVTSALKYDDKSAVYRAATSLVKMIKNK